jgi:DNA-binding transcriptional LysR family regulator
VSVAQVSRQVAQLEDRLQAKLLLRTTRQVRLTELGEIYYRHCRQLLDNLYEAELAVGRHQAVPQGTLRITAPVSYGESRIAPLVNDFMVRFPQLEVTSTSPTSCWIWCTRATIWHAPRPPQGSSLVARKLAQRVPYVCASPAYTARHGMPNSLSELTRHTCLVGNSDEWHFTLDAPQRAGARSAALQQRPRPAGCGSRGSASSSCRTTT